MHQGPKDLQGNLKGEILPTLFRLISNFKITMTMDSNECEAFHLLFGKKAKPQKSPYLRNWGAIVVRILMFFMAMIMTAGLMMTMMVFT